MPRLEVRSIHYISLTEYSFNTINRQRSSIILSLYSVDKKAKAQLLAVRKEN